MRISPALIGPPIHQPGYTGAKPGVIGFTPGPTPLAPPETDPFTPGFTPGIGNGGNPNPSNPAAWSYLDLMRSANLANPHIFADKYTAGAGGNAVPPYVPHAGGFGGDEPQLPGDPGGEYEPGILPGNEPGGTPDPRIGPQPWNPPNYSGPPMMGPHNDIYGRDPFGETGGPEVDLETGITHGLDINGNPIPRNPFLPGGGRYSHFTPNETGGPRDTGTGNIGYGPLFGGGTDHVPNTGGLLGHGVNSTPQEPWYGRLARSLMPYGSGQIAHMIMEYARRHGGGTVGGPAHVVGGNRGPARTGATPSGPSGPAFSPASLSTGVNHWDFTRGAYVPNDFAGGSANNSHAQSMQLMEAQRYGGRPNRNLVNDNMRVAASERGPQVINAAPDLAMMEAFRARYPNGIHAGIDPATGQPTGQYYNWGRG